MPEIHNNFLINDLTVEVFLSKKITDKRAKAFQEAIAEFKTQTQFLFKTSGTTGNPKEVYFDQISVFNSAKATHEFFRLKKGSVVWHVLPLEYVAGKMMLYRALIFGYQLYFSSPTITKNVLKKRAQIIDFVPMVPMQLKKIMEIDVLALKKIRRVLLGGIHLSNQLIDEINRLNLSTKFYESYGTTETLTHVAIKPILPNVRSFMALPKIGFKTINNRLVISAPKICIEPIITNDSVELVSSSEFIWRGRIDNVINSGGIKIFPEEIEKKIGNVIKQPFFLAGKPSKQFGEMLIIVVEGNNRLDFDWSKMGLSSYETPKEICYVSTFSRTLSGKINRKKTLDSQL